MKILPSIPAPRSSTHTFRTHWSLLFLIRFVIVIPSNRRPYGGDASSSQQLDNGKTQFLALTLTDAWPSQLSYVWNHTNLVQPQVGLARYTCGARNVTEVDFFDVSEACLVEDQGKT
ncbi:hypothetical protein PoB_001507600 [Plakobranchus ocellatus]|uniref:Uncharacterized protein n=1 Tax=Plakobranchus ocellatus TaxID=259542 RepID=A0AAV3Z1X7_9GAST|nr:hypothetical protein PoB_001507600 [Plakobranchus ocellatus]